MAALPCAAMSAPAELQPSDVSATQPEPSPSPEELFYASARDAFLSRPKSQGKWLLLVGSLVLFGVSMVGDSGPAQLGLIVGVLFFHELGHLAGMRWFGFQDVKMFFVPFFGAAVSGRNVHASAWQEAVVWLLGPVPGIVLGCGLAGLAIGIDQPALVPAATLLIVLNGLNLMPVVPLDGGRLFQVVVFSRHRYFETAFTLLAAVVLLGVAALLMDWVFALLGVVTFVSTIRQVSVLRIAQRLRNELPDLQAQPDQLSDPALRALYAGASETITPMPEFPPKPEQYAIVMRTLHERVRQRAPGGFASLGLVGAWALALVLCVGGAMLVHLAPRDPVWARHQEPLAPFAVDLPAPPELSAVADEKLGIGARLDASLGHRRNFTVTAWPGESEARPERDQLEASFDRLRDALIKEHEATVASDQTIERHGAAARALELTVPGSRSGLEVARVSALLFESNGQYFALAAERKPSSNITDADVQRFFDSFELLPQPAGEPEAATHVGGAAAPTPPPPEPPRPAP